MCYSCESRLLPNKYLKIQDQDCETLQIQIIILYLWPGASNALHCSTRVHNYMGISVIAFHIQLPHTIYLFSQKPSSPHTFFHLILFLLLTDHNSNLSSLDFRLIFLLVSIRGFGVGFGGCIYGERIVIYIPVKHNFCRQFSHLITSPWSLLLHLILWGCFPTRKCFW